MSLFHFLKTQKEKLKLKEDKNTRIELIKKLKQSFFKIKEEYEEETKEKMEKFNERIKKIIEEIIEKEYVGTEEVIQKKIDIIEEEKKEMESIINDSRITSEGAKQYIEKIVNDSVEYLTKTNFYPPEYIFETNMIKGTLIEIDETLKNNPLKPLQEYIDRAKELEEKIKKFKELHEKTTKLILKIEEKTKTGKAETTELMELKHQLYIYLQRGELKKAEKTIKLIKNKL